MLIGVPKEIKNNEFRVGLTPGSVAELTHHGHSVLVEAGAGLGSGLTDAEYAAAGAELVAGRDAIFARADMVVKVKEPLAEERKLLRRGQVLFTYLHLAPDLAQTRDLMESGATCIAYETVTSRAGRPAAADADVGGRRAAGAASRRACAGEGGGRAGRAARRRAGRAGGRCRRDRRRRFGHPCGDHRRRHGRACHHRGPSSEALRRLSAQFGACVHTAYSTRATIADLITRADLVIGAVLVPGRGGAQADHPGDALDHAAGRRSSSISPSTRAAAARRRRRPRRRLERFQHDLRSRAVEIDEALFRSLVGDGEAAEVAPEGERLREVADPQRRAQLDAGYAAT